MRIFERLPGRSRSESTIERKLFEAVTDDLLRKLEDETSISVFTGSKAIAVPAARSTKRRLSRRALRQIDIRQSLQWQNNR